MTHGEIWLIDFGIPVGSLPAKMRPAVVMQNDLLGINNPDASVGVCCSHKVVAVGFNTLRYDASVGVLNPPHE